MPIHRLTLPLLAAALLHAGVVLALSWLQPERLIQPKMHVVMRVSPPPEILEKSAAPTPSETPAEPSNSRQHQAKPPAPSGHTATPPSASALPVLPVEPVLITPHADAKINASAAPDSANTPARAAVAAAIAALPSTAAGAASPSEGSTPAKPSREAVQEPEMMAEHLANKELFRAPRLSQELGEYGTVSLIVTVGTDGRAKDAVLSKSSGYPRLDNTALRGALRASYKPATVAGVAVERKFLWSIVYKEPD